MGVTNVDQCLKCTLYCVSLHRFRRRPQLILSRRLESGRWERRRGERLRRRGER